MSETVGLLEAGGGQLHSSWENSHGKKMCCLKKKLGT